MPDALYLHLPFCTTKCHYCDFAVRVLEHPAQIDRYLDHLEQELTALAPFAQPLKTLYCGGGTPALLNPTQSERLCHRLHQVFQLREDCEWTLEANPDDLAQSSLQEALQHWQRAGVRRISLGVQSFDDTLLAACGRAHRSTEIVQAVQSLRSLGFAELSLDLIYGLPGQALTQWQNSLRQALQLKPQHLSLYALEVHPQTVFGHRQLNLPSEETSVEMYDWACQTLNQAGFEHYEIANWARPGHQSQHNCVYWRNRPFLAAGVGAHGYLQRRRYANPNQLRDYYRHCQAQSWAWLRTPAQSRAEEIEETVFLGLRLLTEGLNLSEFETRFGAPLEKFYPQSLARFLEQGYLLQSGSQLRLAPEAVSISNAIFAEFLDPVLQDP